MDYTKTAFFKTGRASDLAGKDRVLYRFFEVLPGLLSWGTIFFTIILSYVHPAYSAFFVIAFNTYWVLKCLYLSFHLRSNWSRMRRSLKIDWQERLSHKNHGHIIHLVILPFYKEDEALITKTIGALARAHYDLTKMAIVLAGEDRAGDEAVRIASRIKQKFEGVFGECILTFHPRDTPGEMPGKGSNIAFAALAAKEAILDQRSIPYENVLVSAFDIDTVIYPDYFACLTWYFLSNPNPHRTSYQPVPLYNNNIWDAPTFSRIVAISGSFWQMVQQERPERLTTFSSHSMSFKALMDVGFWQKNIVSEDSRIFWNAFLAYDGMYEVLPLAYPVSLDANLAPGFWETMKNVYKQQRRWAWGVENLPYIMMGFVKNKKIPLYRKMTILSIELERAWSLSTNPLLIFILSWLPLVLGGHLFNTTVLAYNLPKITHYVTVAGFFGLIFSAFVSLSFLPPSPKSGLRYHKVWMVVQWFFVPFTLIIFGSLPALDAQTRLLFGKYLGFWVTPKHRVPVDTSQPQKISI